MKPCVLMLTCTDAAEADIISDHLLSQHLIVCAKQLTTASSFLFNGHRNSANETLLIMESLEENYERIDKAIRKIHSYDTFVLLSIPITKTTRNVKAWMQKELKK